VRARQTQTGQTSLIVRLPAFQAVKRDVASEDNLRAMSIGHFRCLRFIPVLLLALATARVWASASLALGIVLLVMTRAALLVCATATSTWTRSTLARCIRTRLMSAFPRGAPAKSLASRTFAGERFQESRL